MPPPDDEVVTPAKEASLPGEGGGKPARRFTWKELSLLNTPENAHVAVRGKVL